jgi:amidohydrolase
MQKEDTMSNTRLNIEEEAKALNPRIVEWRRHFHAHPEIVLDTPETEAFIVAELEKMGVTKIRRGLAEHGIAALIEGKRPGKTLGLRSDMDALNIKEETGLPFSSTNDFMHACGHDAHMAMLLGAAKILTGRADELKGTIKLIFQPSEENTQGAGAQKMIRDGVLSDPAVDGIVGLHTGNLWKGVASGEVGWRFGSLMASSDFFAVTFHGKGGHGATPHLTVDPIAMACQAYSALQLIASRETSPFEPVVLSIGAIQGGAAENVIPPSCTLRGSFRALNAATRETLHARLKKICEDIADALRGSVEVAFMDGPPPLVNDRGMTDKLRAAASAVLGAERVHELEEPTMGAEDMAVYLEKVPGTFFFLSSFRADAPYPHHHPKFDIDESVLWAGSAVFAQFALTWQS